MIKKVLVVDDDQEMLLSLKEGLEKYDESFSVLMAGDGLIAKEKLQDNTISLVVTDLKMPRMDGFALLTHIMQHNPEIPVIIITAYSTPEMEEAARQGGAVGYIEKPFLIEDLAVNILTCLRKESEGGTLHSVSSGMFLQLIEMEQKTCTIRLVDNATGKQGILFFRDGELLDAKIDGLRGEKAAYEIFSWDNVSLSIQESCAKKDRIIQSELQAILLEAMRLKDEAQGDNAQDEKGSGEVEIELNDEAAERPAPASVIRERLEREIGPRCGVEEILEGDSWDGVLAQMQRIGDFFGAGGLKLAYIDNNDVHDLILKPESKTVLLVVNPKCPRERIIEILSDCS